jgi:hypothetical protein
VTFLNERYRLAPATSTDIAYELLGRAVYPRLVRTLLGVEEPLKAQPEEAAIATDIDLAPIRGAVAALLPAAEVSP